MASSVPTGTQQGLSFLVKATPHLPKNFLVSLIVSDTKWIPVGNVKVRFRYPIPVVLDTSWIPRNPYPIPIGIQLVADTSMFSIR
jgi:hypothetical protein